MPFQAVILNKNIQERNHAMSTQDLLGIPQSTLLLIVIAIVAAAGIIIKIMPRPSHGGAPEHGDPRNLQQYINAVNEYIRRYNNLRDVYMLAAQEKREAILKCEDTESMERLGEIMDGFDMSADDAGNIINAIKDSLSDGKVPMDKYHQLSNDVEMMEQQLQDMKDIMPTMHKHDWNAGWQGNAGTGDSHTDTESYFHGCTTEDEVNKRYRALCKVFHPDSSTGDTDAFRELQDAYEKVKAEMAG